MVTENQEGVMTYLGTQISLNAFKSKVKYKWLNVKAKKSFLTFFVFCGIIYM